jgi:hypothetical protein
MHSDVEEIQFQLVGGATPLIMIPACVNGKGPYHFILDSATSHCLASPELASSLGIDCESEEQIFGGGGAVQAAMARAHSVTVGVARQEGVSFVITRDLERIGAALKTDIGGAIGLNFMKDYRVTLDYAMKTMRIERSSSSSGGETNLPSSFIPFELAPSDPLILLDAFANGQGPFPFTVDTAAGRSVISLGLANQLNVDGEVAVVGAGVGGQIPMRRAKLNSLTVGDATLRDHIVVVGEFFDAISTAAGAELKGVIGNNFLSQFEVTLDYPRRRLGLTASHL